MDAELKAARSKALLSDQHFQAVFEDLRQQQHYVFATSGPKDIEAREEAYSLLRALDQIQLALQSDVDAVKLKQKKG